MRIDIPEYLGVADIAEYTGLSPQRIYQLWHSANMPPPTFYRRYASVWRADRIEAWWKARGGRDPRGRKRKET